MAGSKNSNYNNQNLNIKHTMIHTIKAALATVLLCMILLFLTGMIPHDAIAASCRESAEFFLDRELFPYSIDGQFNSRIDNYSDCILVNIMYHTDNGQLIPSLINASYYQPDYEQINVSLSDAVRKAKEPNISYSRYWHGSLVLLRPLFLFTGIAGARYILGGSLILLTLLVAVTLIRMKRTALAICYLLGNLSVQCWMCLTCVQYMTTFLVMNAVTLCILRIYHQNRTDNAALYQKACMLMAVSGVTVCFVDFLTAETLAVTIPLLVLLVLRYEDGRLQELSCELKRLAGLGMIWLCSYALMFLVKWSLCAVLSGFDALSDILSHAGERFLGAVTTGNTNLDPEATPVERFLGALGRNQGCLFPFRDSMNMSRSLALFALIVCILLLIIYVFRRKDFSGKMLVLCLLLGAVPYARYIILQNHAYIHYFFTYRAQLVTITSLYYCTWRFGLQGFFTAKVKSSK